MPIRRCGKRKATGRPGSSTWATRARRPMWRKCWPPQGSCWQSIILPELFYTVYKMRLLYTLAWWLALPLVLARLWLRGRKEPGYRQHWGERLGLYGGKPAVAGSPSIWVHAVSVGETRAAEPLIDALLVEYPDSRIILTHMTPTGRATGKQLFAKHGARLVQSYLPYDTATMVRSFIKHY